MSEPPAIPSDANARRSPAPFLDVPYLLDASQPRARGSWFAPGIATLIVVVFVSAYFSSKSPTYKSIVDAISALAMIGVVIAMGVVMWTTVRRQQGERARIDAIEELVQLRRWQQAAAMLQRA